MSEAMMPIQPMLPDQLKAAPVVEGVIDTSQEQVADQEAHGGLRKMYDRAKRAGQVALVGIEITPGINEGLRVLAYGASEVVTRGDPFMAGAVAGITTFAIEAAGGAAGASLLETEKADWMMKKTAAASDALKIPKELSKPTKAWMTLLCGTNVGMFLEQRENADRTLAQNRKYNWITSAWLGGTLAVAGTLTSEGINVGIDNPQTVGEITAGLAVLAGGRALNKRRVAKNVAAAEKPLVDTDAKYGYKYEVTADPDLLEQAATLEREVWHKEGYGDISVYDEDIALSTTITARDGEKVIGLARMFDGTKKVPPFLSEMEFYDSELKAKVMQQSANGEIVEMGTAAVAEDARTGVVFRSLLRMFYRQADKQGAEYMACVMEPERVQKYNDKYGLTYEQVGPAVDYQGGDCAPHIMNIKETIQNMKFKHPLVYLWFIRKSLKP